MKLLSEAFDTVKRVYAYEKSVKVDTATLQKIMAVFAIVMILIDVENIRLGKYIIGAATFFVAAVSLVAVWALDYFKNVYRVCRIAAVICIRWLLKCATNSALRLCILHHILPDVSKIYGSRK